MRAMGQRIQPDVNYTEEAVGRLEGISALYKENDVRRLLVHEMANLDVVRDLDVESTKEKTLRDLAKWSDSVEPNLAQAEEAIAAGRRLLTKDNLRQLLPLVSVKEDRRVLNAYLAELPEAHADRLSNA
ncbi:hypothetical protein [Rhodanobacter lindaniclasticus]